MRNKVMLIDDHPAMLMALKSMLLNQVPFEVVAQAQSGEECLSVLKNVQPDIVILDLDMPKTDGFDVIRKIGSPKGSGWQSKYRRPEYQPIQLWSFTKTIW